VGGQKGQKEGVDQFTSIEIYDCFRNQMTSIDITQSALRERKIMPRKWREVNNNMQEVMKHKCNQYLWLEQSPYSEFSNKKLRDDD